MFTKPLIFILLITATVGAYFWLKPKLTPVVVVPPIVDQTVVLLTEEDSIRLFFDLIDQKQIPEAIEMMSISLAPDDTTRQVWAVQFNAIESIKVLQIEPNLPETWSENQHSYQVLLETVVAKEAANAPIPYYGWEDSPNLRWISLEKNSSGIWQIAAIATGP